MSDLWERLAASTPNDRTAATVTSESRDTPEERGYTRPHWKAPPAMMAPTKPMLLDPTFRDLTGTAPGRFVVLGILVVPRGHRGPQQWVLRCACGDYETRRAKAILHPEGRPDRCEDCERLEALRRRETDKAMGRASRVTIEEVVERIKAKGQRP